MQRRHVNHHTKVDITTTRGNAHEAQITITISIITYNKNKHIKVVNTININRHGQRMVVVTHMGRCQKRDRSIWGQGDRPIWAAF